MSTIGPGPQYRRHAPTIDQSLHQFDADGNQTVFAISPFGNSETRQERLDRWERMGTYSPTCQGCAEVHDHPRLDPFAPRHKPGRACQSGSRNHCSCPTCWG